MVDDARADRYALDYLRAGHVAAALALLGAAWTTPAFTAADPPPVAFLRPYLRASDSELRRLARPVPGGHLHLACARHRALQGQRVSAAGRPLLRGAVDRRRGHPRAGRRGPPGAPRAR